MKRLVIVAVLGFLAWQGYTKYQSGRTVQAASESTVEINDRTSVERNPTAETQFKCDGRTYCSQMTSCAEATYFLKNCPGVKMDGNHDGVPCEQQWCR
ncbi:MAG: excalibur calcium-binding domain-containing protein [Rhodocyclaceae bacterium]|nr:excalibur calcium-binding domain-containing protein [Rhodocyclaceae bacterium]MBK9311408.1 excalibur calcium-binding domain-containing protein [Rhodocyclaceae bacterium]MBK9956436.1 excalibur calcium-binding domain-containing protein [Rhodocyclaceae bacterium]